MFVNRLCCKENKMPQPLTIDDDYLDFKSFSKRPILIRQVSADMLSLISYKTAKNNILIKQLSKYFKELNVSALMKGSHGSLNNQIVIINGQQLSHFVFKSNLICGGLTTRISTLHVCE
jgi:hypothetical protein